MITLMAVLITWRETTGMAPSIVMLRERLAAYPLGAVLVAISQVAALLETWNNDTDHASDDTLTSELLPTYNAAIKGFRTAKHVAFSRISLLYVAKQACWACQPDTNSLLPLAASDYERIFSACLMANDLIAERQVTPGDTTLQRAVSLLPLANYVPHGTYPRDLARNLVILEEIAPQLSNTKGYKDLTIDFTEATGVPPREFCEFAVGASIKYLGKSEKPFVLTPHYLQHDSISPAHVKAFFEKSSITTSDLRSLVQRLETRNTDFVPFQQNPLVEVAEGKYVCPDPGFLLDKAGKSLYWTLHAAQPSNQRHQLLTYWSTLIERYAHWLISQTYQGKGTVITSPRFKNGDEVCDAVIAEGSCLIAIEVKASILTVESKYGFSEQSLSDELHLKAITGEGGERKGVAQLHHNLNQFLDGDDLPEIKHNRVRRIYPVLVFLDHSFTSPYLDKLYNEHFDRGALRRRPSRIVTPLFAVTLNDLENALPYTHKHDLSDILESCRHRNR